MAGTGVHDEGHVEERAEQEQELEVLRSIFEDDFTLLDDSPISIEVAINLDLQGPRRVVTKQAAQQQDSALVEPQPQFIFAQTSEGSSAERHQDSPAFLPAALQRAQALLDLRDALGPAPCEDAQDLSDGDCLRHLPPLRLAVTFLRGYPSSQLPVFRLAACWLSQAQLAALCASLDIISAAWSPGVPIVFSWVESLQARSLEILSLDALFAPIVLECSASPEYDPRAVSEMEDPMETLQALQAFDLQRGWWAWKQRAHLCQICLSEKPGTSFSELGACGHGFCTECLTEMLRVHILEGSVASLCCPLPKCRGEVAPGVVRRLVTQPSYDRWRRLEVQRILLELPAMVFCPRCERNGIETPVLPPDGEFSADDSEPPLAVCDRPECRCAFCAACREAYHPGEVCPAQMKRLEALGRQAQGDKSKRQCLAEELMSLRMILAETVPCPKCKIPITRSQGCNHMVCGNCRVHFCYRCGVDITEAGYAHFRADKCPTFDREEVERLREAAFAPEGQEALEAELEALRRQYPEQANMVWNFQPPLGAWRRQARRRRVDDAPCPRCGQWNGRASGNNHMKCRICKSNFCYACRKLIEGTVSLHYRGQGACSQHST